jgi:hypothetical protein
MEETEERLGSPPVGELEMLHLRVAEAGSEMTFRESATASIEDNLMEKEMVGGQGACFAARA